MTLREDILDLWIPIILPWVTVLIWLRKRIRLLRIRGKGGDGYFGYQFAMVAAIAAPLVVSQEYVDKISYDLIEVNSISEIPKVKEGKYFKVNSFDVEDNASLSHVTVGTSGRYNGSLNFNLFYATPLRGSASVWHCVEYKRTISNNLNKQRKNLEYSSFLSRSNKEFNTYNFYSVTYFEKLAISKERDGFINAVKNEYPVINMNDQIFLVPKNVAFKNQNNDSLKNTIIAFLIGTLIILILIILPKIDTNELNRFKRNKPLRDDDFKDFLEFLNPIGTYKGGAILMILNMIIFLIMIFIGLDFVSPAAKELLDIGGNRRQEILNGEYWRLLSSNFIHSGVFHLFQNLLGLAISIVFLEKIIGYLKFILTYVVCGIFAALASFYWHEDVVSVGASGAIFGLYGVMLAFAILKIYSNFILRFTWIFLGLCIGLSLLFGTIASVDNAAHVGGLASGFIIGVIFVLMGKEALRENAVYD
ncbi:rhomboid family intramembrane serine protease [Maribacter sp. R86514]|uniref:rhomboid family intramembrane serine protease n=1 Tax=Maribacter sp. R86514 TaxID=3093854 RepID=UPI0037C6D8E5